MRLNDLLLVYYACKIPTQSMLVFISVCIECQQVALPEKINQVTYTFFLVC